MPIATLIAADIFDRDMISAAVESLQNAGCDNAQVQWLENGKAADILFTGDILAARNALARFEGSADIIVQSEHNRRKMLLISDMDSTMITVECIDELADYAGIKPQIADITERAMQGELDFAQALTARVALLAGLDEATIGTCLAERVRPMPGAEILVKTMAGWGAHTVLVSGGFTHFARPVAAQIGFAEYEANILAMNDGQLSGRLEGEIVDAAAKRALLNKRAADRSIAGELILSVGDGANDIPMLQAAIEGGGVGASYHAKPKAEAAANFAVRHNDLTALLYAQGIKKADWWQGA
ncbi:phosphoserine phosphatase SerB [Sphingorhabdus arenilitoris]|uniref:Phosphoserine phosphatase n=1 Tax=Sphingorhabdus arenilitoris TaxID=1490041 RepID=A0ABV8RHK0_9SPHN